MAELSLKTRFTLANALSDAVFGDSTVLARDTLTLIYVVLAIFPASAFWTDALKFTGRRDLAFAVVARISQTRIDRLLTKSSFPAFIAFAAEVVNVVSAFAVLARIGCTFVYVLRTVSTCPS